jgi:thiol-disulfide isomerase/thioredoxin
MTPKQTWSVAMGISLAFVLGYAGAVFSTAAKLEKQRANEDPFRTLQKRVGNQLPAARLIAPGNTPVPDDSWRRGKVVLVMVTTSCDACLLEAKFLREVVKQHKDVKFVGVLSFEQDEPSLQKAQTIFPFPVVRDDRMALMLALGITGVPVKIYLEDGVVKQSWGGAAMTEQARASFTQWLNTVA